MGQVDDRRRRAADRAAVVLGVVLAVTGTLHVLRPGPFEGIVPGSLGAPLVWVLVSGAAELACAVGLLAPRTRRVAGWATAALFVVVFPANVQMAVDALQGEGAGSSVVVALVRLPLQVPLVLWAVWVARRATGRAQATVRDGSSTGR